MLMCKFQKAEIPLVSETQITSDDFAAVAGAVTHGSIGDLCEANVSHLPADKEERKYGAETIS
jgi:hypothetical protein